MRRGLLIALSACLLLVAGCGDDKEATPTETATETETETTTQPVEMETIRAYFLRDGKVWPVAREVQPSRFATRALLPVLLGPTEQEMADLGLSTAIPNGTVKRGGLEGDVAVVELSEDIPRAALAQIVYTLTQFADVKTVKVGQKTYTRADFEDQTPAILVESPLPFEEVTSPVRATGTANTFEATFQYDLTDTDGKIVDTNFVTATSGTGTRGTFDFTTKEFTVPFDGIGALIVYELSAEDGKTRLHLVEIPLKMSK